MYRKEGENIKCLVPQPCLNEGHVNHPVHTSAEGRKLSLFEYPHGKRAVMATCLPVSPFLRNKPHEPFRALGCSVLSLQKSLVCAPMQAAPGAGMAYSLSHCHVGTPAGKDNKPQRASLDIAQCLWRKADEGAGLFMGRASEEKLAGRTTLVSQLTREIGCSGGRTGKCLIAEECSIDSGQMLSVPSCLCPCRALNLTSALKQNLCCHRFQLPLRSSRPAFEAGSRKCLSRVTSKSGAWCRHTEAECLGPGLREEHVVSPSRCLH